MSGSGNGGNDDAPLRPAAKPVPVAPKPTSDKDGASDGDQAGGGAGKTGVPVGSACYVVERTKNA